MPETFEVKNRFEAIILFGALTHYLACKDGATKDLDIDQIIGLRQMTIRLEAIMYPADPGWGPSTGA